MNRKKHSNQKKNLKGDNMKYYAVKENVAIPATVRYNEAEGIETNSNGILLMERGSAFAYDKKSKFGDISLGEPAMNASLFVDDNGVSKPAELIEAYNLNGRANFKDKEFFVLISAKQYNKLTEISKDNKEKYLENFDKIVKKAEKQQGEER